MDQPRKPGKRAASACACRTQTGPGLAAGFLVRGIVDDFKRQLNLQPQFLSLPPGGIGVMPIIAAPRSLPRFACGSLPIEYQVSPAYIKDKRFSLFFPLSLSVLWFFHLMLLLEYHVIQFFASVSTVSNVSRKSSISIWLIVRLGSSLSTLAPGRSPKT